jgi:hypothetical protein
MDFAKLTVKDLKAQLKELGLPITGRKNELIERLHGADEQETSYKEPDIGNRDEVAPDSHAGEQTRAREEQPMAVDGPPKEGQAKEVTPSHHDTDMTVDESVRHAAADDGSGRMVGGLGSPDSEAAVAEVTKSEQPPAAVAEPQPQRDAAEKHGTSVRDIAVSSDDEALSMGSDDDEPVKTGATGRKTSSPCKPAPRPNSKPSSQKELQRAFKDAPESTQHARKGPAPIVFPYADKRKTNELSVTPAPATDTQETSSRRAPAMDDSAEGMPITRAREPPKPADELPAGQSKSKRKHAAIIFEPDSAGGTPAAAPPPAKAARKEVDVLPADGVTRALRIDGFRRPLRESELRELLGETGCASNFACMLLGKLCQFYCQLKRILSFCSQMRDSSSSGCH